MKKKTAFFAIASQVLILAFFVLTQTFTSISPEILEPFITPFFPTGETLGSSNEDSLVVSKVIDGDTIELLNGQKVRYIGIDTPETNSPQKKNECFASEAKNKNRELVEDKFVRLEKDVSETDRYGRLLRYVYIDDVMVNEVLVSEGYAVSATFPPDVKYQEKFRLAEQQARKENKGLWSTCSVLE